MNNINQENILSNITVIFVEDEEFARLELSKYLKRRVGRLIVGKDGLEGLELIKRYNPDIVITDLKMPGMTGLDMLREAREEGYRGGAIISSALSDSDTIIEAMDIGVVKYIVKPVDTENLISSMGDIATEIMTQRVGKVVIDKKYMLDRDQKKELEDGIKSKIAFFIKKYTGKGPKNIRVFIQGNTVKVEAEEVLTLFEQSIIVGGSNHSLVEYNRRIFYYENKQDLESAVREAINSDVELIDVNADSKKNIDFLNFSYE